MATSELHIDAEPDREIVIARRRRAGMLAWVVLLQAIAFDIQLLAWTVAVLCAVAVVEFVLVRFGRSRAMLALGHLALACGACAHAWVCLSAFDVGLSLLASAVALGASAMLVLAHGLRRTTRVCAALAGSAALLAAVELAHSPCIAWPNAETSEPFERWSVDLFHPDPELGWVMQKSAMAEDDAYLDPGHVEWRAVYHTDENGGRAVPGRPSSGPALLLFGCSFTFGHGLDDADTIAAELQRKLPNARVFNYGALAYGTAQSWLALRRCGERTVNQVVYVFIDDHLRRDGADRGWLRQFPGEPLFELDSSGRLQRSSPGCLAYVARRVGWSLWKRSFVFRRLDALTAVRPDDERDVRRAAAIIEEMRADVRSKWGPACRFVTLFAPEAQEREMNARSRRLHDALRQRGIECLDGFAEVGRTSSDAEAGSGSARFDRATGHPRPALAAEIAAEIAGWIARTIEPGAAMTH